MQVQVCVGRFEIKQGILYDSVIIVPQCMANIIFYATEHFSVTFRTSQKKREIGFELSVTCFEPTDLKKLGMCVHVCIHTYVTTLCI